MTAPKKNPPQKQAKKNEDFEQKASGFGLKSFLLLSVSVIVLGCIAAYSLRDIPAKKRPSPVRAEEAVVTQVLNCECPEDTSEAQIEHLQQTIAMLRKALSKQADEVENLKRIDSQRGKEVTLSIQLLEALYTGKPFEAQANALKDFNPNAQLLERISALMPQASRGIPTIEKVRKDFFNAYSLAEQSFYIKRGGTRQRNNLILFLRSLIRVRPQKITEKNPTGVLQLYQAEEFIKQGNIAMALQSVQNFPPAPKNMMGRFINDASLYLEFKKCFE